MLLDLPAGLRRTLGMLGLKQEYIWYNFDLECQDCDEDHSRGLAEATEAHAVLQRLRDCQKPVEHEETQNPDGCCSTCLQDSEKRWECLV